MKILQIKEAPLLSVPFLSAMSGGGRTEARELPLLDAEVDGLPDGLRGIFVASDLQGYAGLPEPRLVGYALADALVAWCEAAGAPPRDFGVILAGDLYAYPDLVRRGGLGNVDGVWEAFGERFRWVVGVGGNHDLFEGQASVRGALSYQKNAHPLDGACALVDGLRIAGVSGVVARMGKAWRRDLKAWKKMTLPLLNEAPDVLVLHHGPNGPTKKFAGHAGIRKILEARSDCPLVICGHRHWRTPLVKLRGGGQVLNVDSRAVLLRVR